MKFSLKRFKHAILAVAVATASMVFCNPGAVVNAGDEPGTAHPDATVYEAEDADLSGGAKKSDDHTGFTGTGFVGGYDNSASSKTSFNVNVNEAGTYYLSFRYSAGSVGGWPADRTLSIGINGTSVNAVFKGTDSTWNTWLENIAKYNLKAGSNTITVSSITDAKDNSDCINLDRLSIWKYSDAPVVDALYIEQSGSSISVGSKLLINVKTVDSNGVVKDELSQFTLSCDKEGAFDIDNTAHTITALKAGIYDIKAENKGVTGIAKISVSESPSLIADCADITRAVDPCMFGYILTPNYDVPDSRLTLLGNLLNRETLPVQTFQAIGDMDGSYYQYESSILERHLEAFKRAKSCGCDWYMLMGHNPSWATASGSPVDTTENKPLKTPEQLANFKQYIKDMLQYMKDNGVKPDYADLTNEYWTGTEETYKVVWEALREVYPDDIPAVGPGGVGYDGIPDFYIPYVNDNDLSLEGPSWHAFWTSDTYVTYSKLLGWADNIRDYQVKYPKANGEYVIWEENNAGSTNPTDWVRSMSNVIRTGVDKNVKGCMESHNSNGMSDIITTNVKQKNPAARRPIWWVYYMFSQMSGDYVNVTTTSQDEAFTGAVSVDSKQKLAKVIIAKNELDGSVNVELNSMPFDINNVSIDLYKITNSEADGLTYQNTIMPSSVDDKNLKFTVDAVKAGETWFAVVKTAEAKPGLFAQMTPDDGDAVTASPEFTWSESVGAKTYTLTASKDKELKDIVLSADGITGTSYTAPGGIFEKGNKYYWSVTAVNANGSSTVSHDVKYSFLVVDDTSVPGQFGPYMPSVGAKNESEKPELKWSTAYNAVSYHVIISENQDFSNPVVDQHGIKTVRGTGQFGDNSQGYYAVSEALKYKTTYYWIVYAENSSGERPMNGVLHYFTTKAEGNAPEAFALTYPQNGTSDVSGRTELSWEASANAFFYDLQVSENADMSNPVISREYMIYNKYTVEQNILEPGKSYYWTVTAYTKDKKESTESQSGVYSFTVEKVSNAPLLYSEYPGEKNGTVTLYYRTSNGANSYNIYYGREKGVYTRKITGVTDDHYTVSGLKGGDTYYFAVKAVNQSGESSIWNVRSEIPGGTGDNWSESQEEGINIAPVVPATASPIPKQPPVPADNGKLPVTTYVQSVTSVTQTPTVNVSKSAVKKPARTVIKKLSSPKKGKLKVLWKKIKANGYKIMIASNKKMTKGRKIYTVKSVSKTSELIKGLKSKRLYYVKIRAYNGSGSKIVYGKWSSSKKVKIK